jgi:hypothetical protein
MLDESTKNREWTTAGELEVALGWNRSEIDISKSSSVSQH